MATDFDESVPEESEQLDQLQPDDSLIDRGVSDSLDEGYIAPDHWSAAQGFGNTPDEMRTGETLEQRVAQEEPDAEPTDPDADWNPMHEKREVGNARAGRLVDSHGGYDDQAYGDTESIGRDVGFAGGAASAEEAAMHVIDESDVDSDDDLDADYPLR